ncbi:Orexin receptor type 2 [Holothuria leucospilota]|uniref:Orexin receptor type 2 n=1 Tax=Holothuria leucospilota TaxID=206669 RepID=A0A9Q1C4X3_HOLLE|nr:Orexin receptor type 2 [Holothuria leucospilota]
MVVQRLFNFELDRVLRDNFSDGSVMLPSSQYYDYYNDDYNGHNWDFCNNSSGFEWAAIVFLINMVFGVLTSSIYLIVTMRHYTSLPSNYLFLNNFLLASFVNLLSTGIFVIISSRSPCWYMGRVLCKALPTIAHTSENAMLLFIIAIILEQNNLYVHSFLSKNTKFRKRITTTVLWLVAVVFLIPEVIAYETHLVGSGSLCRMTFYQHHHRIMFIQKELLLEYFVPLLLLIVTLIHAAVVSSKGSNWPTVNQDTEDNCSRNDGNGQQRDRPINNQCPSIRMTSIVIGVVFFVTKTPYYVLLFLNAFFLVYYIFLFYLTFILYSIPSIVAPVVVMFSSPVHKKRLKETYQSFASCIAGRRVNEGFLLSAKDEEKL